MKKFNIVLIICGVVLISVSWVNGYCVALLQKNNEMPEEFYPALKNGEIEKGQLLIVENAKPLKIGFYTQKENK